MRTPQRRVQQGERSPHETHIPYARRCALALAPAAALAERGASGHLNIIYWQAPSTLNPFLSGGTKEIESASLVLESMARFDNTGTMVPWLAESIPTVENGGVSEDLTSITWTIAEGIMWSDGTPLTSADFASSPTNTAPIPRAAARRPASSTA
jgi:peptide/nickel transport system substrate-binding protein